MVQSSGPFLQGPPKDVGPPRSMFLQDPIRKRECVCVCGNSISGWGVFPRFVQGSLNATHLGEGAKMYGKVEGFVFNSVLLGW